MPTRSTGTTRADARAATRRKLVEVGVRLVREQGFAATGVDAVCAAAGVTKGAFFHHFSTKDDYGVAVARHWAERTGKLFDAAAYHRLDDPRARVFAYLELRREMLVGDTASFTCVGGTLVQEVHRTSPAITAAAREVIFGHAASLVDDLAAAKAACCPHAEWTPESLAQFVQATLQGAFVLAKAAGGPAVAREMIDHLRRYLELLFAAPSPTTVPRARRSRRASRSP